MNPTHGNNGNKDTKTAAPPIPVGNSAKPAETTLNPAATTAAPATASADEEAEAPSVRRRFYVFHKNGQAWDFKNKAEMSKFFNNTKGTIVPPRPEDVIIIQGHKVETKHKVAF